MYNQYFGFSCSPFENNLDQQFLYFSECHEEVIASLLYFIQEKKSFALVCGDVGTGKTMIIHHLLGRLPRSVEPILIPYPDVEYIEILRYIARILKVNSEGKGVLDLTDDIKVALTKASLHGQQVVLIIDEAHLLPIGSLEHIRLLSNIEITANKLLQILLIGQNELSHKLRRREMRQLLQRINVNRFLSPMSRSETIEYMDHRLRVAGSGFDTCFESACKKLIYKMTGGVPRNINRLCDTALLVCMTEKGDKVTVRIIKKAHDALHSDELLAPKESKPVRFFRFRQFSAEKLKPALAAGALVVVLALGFLGYKGNLVGNLKGWIYGPDSPKSANTLVERPLPPVSEVKREETPEPPVAEEKNSSSVSEVKREETSAPPEVVEKSPSSVSEVKREETSEPPGVVVEKSPSSSMPDAVTPPTPAIVQGTPAVLPKEDESVDNKEVNVMKIDTDSPSVEKSGPIPAPPEETQANDQDSNTNRESAQAPARDDQIATKSENPNATAQNLQTVEKALAPYGVFTITIKKGDTLRGIAARWFPEDPASGEKLILSANPQIDDGNRMIVGQPLRIPVAK
ncbi:MAG: AAA family ATPase [Syntrophobacteraceae bacterium]